MEKQKKLGYLNEFSLDSLQILYINISVGLYKQANRIIILNDLYRIRRIEEIQICLIINSKDAVIFALD